MRKLNVPAKQRRGAVSVLIAIMLPLLLLVAAFAINMEQIQLTRAELRVAADSAARAGSRQLSRTQSIEEATAAIIDAASRNTVDGKPLTLVPGDIQFGVNTHASPEQMAAGSAPWLFAPHEGDGPINALRVTASKATDSASGDVPTLFGSVFSATKFQPVITSGAMHIDRDIVLVVDRSGSMSHYGVDLSTYPPYVDWLTAGSAWYAAISEARAPVMEQKNALTQPLTDAFLAGQITAQEWTNQIIEINATFTPLIIAADATVTLPPPGPLPYIPTRWDVLTDSINAFLTTLEGTLPEEKAGLVSFDNGGAAVQPLTFQYNLIRNAMDQLCPSGQTGIGPGMLRGADELTNPQTARPFAQKVLVAFGDGETNQLGVAPDIAASQVIQDKPFVVIHSLTYGPGGVEPVIQTVAEIGGGRYWHASDPGALDDAYHAIAVDIPTVLTD